MYRVHECGGVARPKQKWPGGHSVAFVKDEEPRGQKVPAAPVQPRGALVPPLQWYPTGHGAPSGESVSEGQ
jgi:hypothetical protein